MARRGSTVRVRQRALEKAPQIGGFFCRGRLQDAQYAVRVEPFMEPSGSGARSKASEMGAFDEGVTQTSLPGDGADARRGQAPYSTARIVSRRIPGGVS